MNGLVQQGKELSVWSWTIAIRGDDISIAEVKGVLKDMKTAGIVQDGIMVLKKGEVEKNLHCQIMMQSNFKDGSAYNANAMRNILEMRRVFERGYCNQVVKHKLDENRDWLSLAWWASYTSMICMSSSNASTHVRTADSECTVLFIKSRISKRLLLVTTLSLKVLLQV
jgi:CTP synthase (UTP-ammonia lyase)